MALSLVIVSITLFEKLTDVHAKPVQHARQGQFVLLVQFDRCGVWPIHEDLMAGRIDHTNDQHTRLQIFANLNGVSPLTPTRSPKYRGEGVLFLVSAVVTSSESSF